MRLFVVAISRLRLSTEPSTNAELESLLLNLVVMIAILAVSAIITQWFARTMYIRCACGH